MSTSTPAEVDPHLPTIRGNENVFRWDAGWLLVLAASALLAILVLVVGNPFDRIFRFVLDGLRVTVTVTLVTFGLVLVVGIFGALGRLSTAIPLRGIATLYVEVVRGIPLLVQLYFWYYAFPSIVRDLGARWNIESMKNFVANPYVMAIAGLTLCYGAYMTEVYRAGIQSIPKGQMEAARSLGMTYVQAMRYIILPQAIRVILPPVGNEFITLLKDSSLVSAVAVADLTRRGREFQAITPLPLHIYLMIGLMYLIMTLLSARVVAMIEARMSKER
ncbi:MULTISPECIES: amino acid ABC transporter permease [Anaerolinea]|jgi:polar amino acid transport system permease protein|uniref:amino acid ABC transporter permease n=1 Tax=Anaerolinea TaxID=233189 RepID=UPI00260623AD|nr:amino acid ABC transporter permease [Anaerolinea thermophila]